MTQARYINVIVRLTNAGNKFYTYSRKLKFDGYKKVYQHYEDKDVERDIQVGNLRLHQKLSAKTIEIKEHTSQPPARYNQASLIKTLDESGVGRPSTYRSMANMAIERGYARLDNRAYMMLPIGNTVIEGLSQYFPYVVDKNFTKEMEEHLDDIANKDER
jgi:DNA topoisomerase-1